MSTTERINNLIEYYERLERKADEINQVYYQGVVEGLMRARAIIERSEKEDFDGIFDNLK